MERNSKAHKCKRCGCDCEYFRNECSHGWECKNCGFSVATTYNPFKEVAYYYQIYLKPELPMTNEKYKYLSNLLGLNYLEIKNGVGHKEFVVTRDIYKTLHVMENLDKLGIKHKEIPEYPYSPNDKIYKKIKANNVFL